ncbi:MAG: aldo/keto reductase [Paracoccaceae bacterium]
MQRTNLGRTGIEVSRFCLGTMTFGTQTAPRDAHAQLDRARDAGIDFLDTAEMYPTNPTRAETVGRTEEIIGDWFARTGRRGEWIVATKHTGAGLAHIRDGAPISAASIPAAVEGSLRRLRTDVIDLYQFHWPNRGAYSFRRNWRFDPTGQDRDETLAHMEETLDALSRQVEKGNIRAFGLSNETAWGTAQWLRLAEARGAPRVATIQNEYSLLCRLFDTDLAELCHHEQVGLLAFSPLAAGLLTGKYQGGAVPAGSRMAATPGLGGRDTPRAPAAVAAYLQLAARFGLDPVQMALAFVASRPFTASVILGASSLAQLDHALGATALRLSPEQLDAIDETHAAHPMPF